MLSGSFGRLISSLSPLILVPLFLSSWGKASYGEWLILTALPSYFFVCPDLGITVALQNKIAVCGAENDRKTAQILYSSGMIALGGALIILLILIGILIWSFDFRPFLNISLMSKEEVRWILLLNSLQMLFIFLAMAQGASYRYTGLNARASLFGSLVMLGQITVGAFFLFRGVGCLGYSVILCIFSALKFLILSADSLRLAPWLRVSLRNNSFRALSPYIRPGMGFVTIQLVNMLNAQGTLLMLNWATSSTVVAVFQVCRTVTNAIAALLNIFWMSVYPELAVIRRNCTLAVMNDFVSKMLRITNLSVVAGIIVFMLCGNMIYHLWIARNFEMPATLMFLLLLLFIPGNVYNALNLILAAENEISCTIKITLFCRLAGLVLVYAFAFYWGQIGAGIALLLIETAIAMGVLNIAASRLSISRWNILHMWKIHALPADVYLLLRQTLKKGA